jgi:hypothetical protein
MMTRSRGDARMVGEREEVSDQLEMQVRDPVGYPMILSS